MNASFYLAISRIPLGTVGAIEFVGPISLAAMGACTFRNLTALAFATGGVFLLADVRLEGEPIGFLFAFINAALFLAYIVIGHRLAQGGGAEGIDRLAGAMLVALIVITPLGFSGAEGAILEPILLLAGIGVGICSSVIPYITDQLVMARVSRSTFALLLSLLPVFGSLIGIAVLQQIPTLGEVAGILLVAVGVAFHRQDSPVRIEKERG
jgi:inner membrane transporter RhtA